MERSDTVSTSVEPEKCPRCQSTRFVRNGHSGNSQRYLCKECRCTFGPASQKPTTKLQEKFARFISLCPASSTLRQLAGMVGVSLTTAFRWRHKYLDSLLAQPVAATAGTIYVGRSVVTTAPISQTPTSPAAPTTVARHPVTPILLTSDDQIMGNVVHLMKQDQNGVSLENLFVSGTNHIFDYNPLLAPIVLPGTIVGFPSGRLGKAVCNRQNPSSPVQFKSMGNVQFASHVLFAESGRAWQKAADLVARIYRRWMRGFYGVALKNVQRYAAWYRICWRNAVRKYAYSWEQDMVDLLLNGG